MGIKDLINRIGKEARVVAGEETKDRTYSCSHTYPNEATAREAFTRAKEKLFNVDDWSTLAGISSNFGLYDPAGVRKATKTPEVGDHIRIDVPGPVPVYWVRVTAVHAGADEAEFTVSPSPDPQAGQDAGEVKHFFRREASSTFRVERRGDTLTGWEIGKNEGINNQDEQAGNHGVVNTLVAEGGWAGFQALQWKKLTEYLVQPLP
jgi:hypothetical protein